MTRSLIRSFGDPHLPPRLSGHSHDRGAGIVVPASLASGVEVALTIAAACLMLRSHPKR
jgi:hypothetical protein